MTTGQFLRPEPSGPCCQPPCDYLDDMTHEPDGTLWMCEHGEAIWVAEYALGSPGRIWRQLFGFQKRAAQKKFRRGAA